MASSNHDEIGSIGKSPLLSLGGREGHTFGHDVDADKAAACALHQSTRGAARPASDIESTRLRAKSQKFGNLRLLSWTAPTFLT